MERGFDGTSSLLKQRRGLPPTLPDLDAFR